MESCSTLLSVSSKASGFGSEAQVFKKTQPRTYFVRYLLMIYICLELFYHENIHLYGEK